MQTINQKDIKFNLSLVGSDFSQLEPITLLLTIENMSSIDITISQSNAALGNSFEIKSSDGQLVEMTSYGRLVADQNEFSLKGRFVVAPRERHESTVVINKYYDMTIPDSYSITASQDVIFQNNEVKGIKSNVVYADVNT